MMTQPVDLDEVMSECHDFHRNFDTLLMATCNTDGVPEASYAPYIKYMEDYYIYVSELAAHTANLITTKQCSILFIEDESQAKNVFARRRLTLQCGVVEVTRDTVFFEDIMEMFGDKFGDFMNMMRNLHDFHLLRLRPKTGNYVAGFAQAYQLSGEGLNTIQHRNEKGHSYVRSPKTTSQEAS